MFPHPEPPVAVGKGENSLDPLFEEVGPVLGITVSSSCPNIHRNVSDRTTVAGFRLENVRPRPLLLLPWNIRGDSFRAGPAAIGKMVEVIPPVSLCFLRVTKEKRGKGGAVDLRGRRTQCLHVFLGSATCRGDQHEAGGPRRMEMY
jgi:hypothetical protein